MGGTPSEDANGAPEASGVMPMDRFQEYGALIQEQTAIDRKVRAFETAFKAEVAAVCKQQNPGAAVYDIALSFWEPWMRDGQSVILKYVWGSDVSEESFCILAETDDYVVIYHDVAPPRFKVLLKRMMTPDGFYPKG